MRVTVTATLVVACLAVACIAGCGDGGGEADSGSDPVEEATADVEPDPEPDATPDVAEDPVEEFDPGACEGFATGLNTGFVVDGTARDFYLDLPSDVDTGGPWPVVFNWHGMGDTAANMRMLFSGAVDNTTMPFILVTPEDTNVVLLGLTVDWWVHAVDENNIEVRLFDEVLACLDHLYGVDWTHVHSLGFSLGGFVTDMLGTIRGEVVASLVTYSGAYGCNAENLTGSMLAGVVTWPEHSVENKYEQIFLHGGASDTYSLFVESLRFEQYAANDAAFLNARGHDVVICNHSTGHNVPMDFRAERVVEFFAAHPLDAEGSAWGTSGLPSTYPTYCTFQAAD